MKNCEISCEPDETRIKSLKEFMESLPNDEEFEVYASKLKALSDPTRIKILYLLSDGELCVCEIMSTLDKPQSSVSHHLNILKNLGFIKGRKEGIWIYYSLKSNKITEIVQELLELI